VPVGGRLSRHGVREDRGMNIRYADAVDCGGPKPWRALCTCGYASRRYLLFEDALVKAHQHNERHH